MLRRHPVLTAVSVAYFGALCVMVLLPRSDAPSHFVATVVVFLPMGPLLVALLGRHRWLTALGVGLLAASWLQLACVVWTPSEVTRPEWIVASGLGVVIGTLVALGLGALAHRFRTQRTPSFTRLSQTGQSPLTSERSSD